MAAHYANPSFIEKYWVVDNDVPEYEDLRESVVLSAPREGQHSITRFIQPDPDDTSTCVTHSVIDGTTDAIEEGEGCMIMYGPFNDCFGPKRPDTKQGIAAVLKRLTLFSKTVSEWNNFIHLCKMNRISLDVIDSLANNLESLSAEQLVSYQWRLFQPNRWWREETSLKRRRSTAWAEFKHGGTSTLHLLMQHGVSSTSSVKVQTTHMPNPICLMPMTYWNQHLHLTRRLYNGRPILTTFAREDRTEIHWTRICKRPVPRDHQTTARWTWARPEQVPRPDHQAHSLPEQVPRPVPRQQSRR